MKKKWNKRLHTPSLYLCTTVIYRTVRQEKSGISYILLIAFLMPHCPVTVVQRYRDGVCSLLFHLFFIICHPYIPLHLEEMIFYSCVLYYVMTHLLVEHQEECRLNWDNTLTLSSRMSIIGRVRLTQTFTAPTLS